MSTVHLHFNIGLPPHESGPRLVVERSAVWCDSHGAVHDRDGDPYDEGIRACGKEVWRDLYMEPDDDLMEK